MIVQLKPVENTQVTALEALIQAVYETNKIALDKTLAEIDNPKHRIGRKTAIVASIGERMCRAVVEIGMTLPEGIR